MTFSRMKVIPRSDLSAGIGLVLTTITVTLSWMKMIPRSDLVVRCLAVADHGAREQRHLTLLHSRHSLNWNSLSLHECRVQSTEQFLILISKNLN